MCAPLKVNEHSALMQTGLSDFRKFNPVLRIKIAIGLMVVGVLKGKESVDLSNTREAMVRSYEGFEGAPILF